MSATRISNICGGSGGGISQSDADDRYLNQSSNLSDLESAAAARTNLGLIAGGTGDIWVEKAGDTMTGNLGIGVAPTNPLSVLGNFNVQDAVSPAKQYRFRVTGTDLDFDGSGAQLLLSVYSGADFTGTQRSYMRFGASSSAARALGCKSETIRRQCIMH